jgi:hypothetical protein
LHVTGGHGSGALFIIVVAPSVVGVGVNFAGDMVGVVVLDGFVVVPSVVPSAVPAVVNVVAIFVGVAVSMVAIFVGAVVFVGIVIVAVVGSFEGTAGFCYLFIIIDILVVIVDVQGAAGFFYFFIDLVVIIVVVVVSVVVVVVVSVVVAVLGVLVGVVVVVVILIITLIVVLVGGGVAWARWAAGVGAAAHLQCKGGRQIDHLAVQILVLKKTIAFEMRVAIVECFLTLPPEGSGSAKSLLERTLRSRGLRWYCWPSSSLCPTAAP